MPTIQQICDFLDSVAPTRLAEDWDNVGLLTGDPDGKAKSIMTCLTITPESAAEAIVREANLIVSHHPLPFRPFKKLTTDQTSSRILWNLTRAGIAIYSPHTGFDSARKGINQSLAERIGLTEIQPLNPIPNDPDNLGSGRFGKLPSQMPLRQLLGNLKHAFATENLQVIATPDEEGRLLSSVQKIAVACGSGGTFLEQAVQIGCDTFITGETNFHTCLEASARDVNLILMGHYSSERFAVEQLAVQLAAEFNDAEVWASEKESDPVLWV